MPDADPPARKAAWAMQDESSLVGTSVGVFIAQHSAPPALVVCLVPSGRWQPTLPVSLPLPHFAIQNFAPDTAQSHSVATQLYPSSLGSLAAGSLPDEAAESRDNTIRSTATLLSITDHAANLQLLTPPLNPFPDEVLLQADPALLFKLTQTYNDFLPPQEPVPAVDPPPVLSREGPFDASSEPAATSDHPLISNGLTGCPYHMTSYRQQDIASVDLRCTDAPSSVPGVCGCTGVGPPAEWLQVMDQRDTLCTALQLQRDAGMMSSNLTVLHQYATAFHHMSTEVLHSVFGWEFFPSRAVDDAAPVPHVFRASTQMAAMGLWRLQGWPGRFRAGYYNQGEDCLVCPMCQPRPSG